MRRLDLALFLFGETALTRGELAQWAARFGFERDPGAESGQLMHVVPVTGRGTP
jgi:hypothetical protein